MREQVNILVVDDSPVSLIALENTLASSEIHIVKAASGNEALARLLETEFACIILDVKIPDIDGFELARIVRGDPKTRYLPIIFVTGQVKGEENIFRGYEVGAFDYLIKPVDPVILKGKVNLFAELFRKEIERKAALKALAANESHTRTIISNAIDAFVAVDDAGFITEWNASAERTFGWKRDEVIGKSLAMTILPARFRSLPMDHGVAGLVGREDIGSQRLEIEAVNREGREFPVEISLSESVSGQKVAYYAFIHDISDRKKADMEIRKAKEELELRVKERTQELTEQAAELTRSNQELARFAYVSSHDLKEPLRMVLMYTQLLQAELTEISEEAREFLQYVVEGSSRMAKLIDDLLVYARVGKANENIALVDLGKVFSKVVEDLKASIIETKAEVRCAKLPVLSLREAQISQVFQNLISNAIKFRGDKKPQIEIDVEERDGDYLFKIQDQGIGIDPKYHSRIFEIFQRLHTRESYPGTGIGLSVCKKIIELHGGRIWVDSRLGEGSIFQFTLPKHNSLGRRTA